MNYIPMSVLEYRFDDMGNTIAIIVSFNVYDNENSFNSNVKLTEENVNRLNPALELDKMNKNQCDTIARRILKEWVDVKRPIDDPIEEE